MVVSQSDVFPALPQVATSFQQTRHRKCPMPCPKDNPEEGDKIHQEHIYEVPQDRDICFPSYSPVLPHFPRVPTRIMGQVTFNMQWQ